MMNYGNKIPAKTRTWIVKLLKGESIAVNTGISKDDILDMLTHPGDKVVNVVSGQTIEEASKNLPDNTNERIAEAAILIKVRCDYKFQLTELTGLIEYLDSYPMDPKITWGYTIDPNIQDRVNIITLKILKTKK